MTNIQTIFFLLQFSFCISENKEIDSDISTPILKNNNNSDFHYLTINTSICILAPSKTSSFQRMIDL